MSDIHLTVPKLPWRREDWFNKRLAAWFNYRCLGRGKRFKHADEVLQRLMAETQQRGIDHVIFSGDASALGFEPEFQNAAATLQVNMRPGLAVPGNHDYCTVPAAASGNFERSFAPWLAGRRIGTETYPFAQRVGPVWLIGVNSATGNRLAWDAGGAAGPAQRERLSPTPRANPNRGRASWLPISRFAWPAASPNATPTVCATCANWWTWRPRRLAYHSVIAWPSPWFLLFPAIALRPLSRHLRRQLHANRIVVLRRVHRQRKSNRDFTPGLQSKKKYV